MTSFIAFIKQQFRESASVKMELAEKYPEEIEKIADLMIKALKSDNKILWCGNGGSAADSQHLSTELVSRFMFNRPAIPSLALTTNTSLITAHANDFGFDSIFSRQVEALGNRGDILVAISTSGNSQNLIQAIQTAKSNQIITIALSGNKGGKIKNLADFSIIVPSDSTQRIQEGHITIGHILCDLIEQSLYGETSS